MQAGDTAIVHEGVYRVIDRPRSLAFTWVSGPAGNTLVTVDFEEVGPAETLLTLKHERFDTDNARDNHQRGWSMILDALARVMEAE